LADDAVATYANRVGEIVDLATVTDGVTALAVSAISKGK
jgi:hypothetical protein